MTEETFDKMIDTVMRDIFLTEDSMEEKMEDIVEETPEPAPETAEQREERLKREDYERRDAEAWAERERILGGPQSRDPEAATRRCCF